MFKLMIVDDEMLVRMGLKTTIDWPKLGFQIAGEADNGLKALEIARAIRPDLGLTDIRMPKLDGLGLMKALKKELPRTKILILSCYQDFDYVREALQLGALDYIPKLSMQVEELEQVFQRAKAVLEEEAEQERIADAGREPERYRSLREMQGCFFQELLKGALAEPDLAERLVRLKLRLGRAGLYGAVCLLVDDLRAIRQRNGGTGLALLESPLLNIIDEALENSGLRGNVFMGREGEFGLVFSFAEGTEAGSIPEELGRFCGHLRETIRLYFNLSVSFGIGQVASGLLQLKEIYNQASEAAGYRLYQGKGSVNLFREESFAAEPLLDAGQEQNLRELLESGRGTEAESLVLGLLDRASSGAVKPPMLLRQELLEVLLAFSRVLKQYGGRLDQPPAPPGGDPMSVSAEVETLGDWKLWFHDFAAWFGHRLNELKVQRFGREVSRALEYINRHYATELKLGEIADQIGMNETYFSHLFKKETGANFTDYVNGLRIEKAKQLLRNRTDNIYEIAAAVGYANVSYFSKVFKQIVGISPAEYKKGLHIK
jgi:two-component system response regulator YesN